MKKIILAPDSFKGTLSAQEICAIQQKVLEKYFPNAEIISVPMADGGEGMVSSYLSVIGGTPQTATVTGPLGENVDAVYGILPNNSAVIEMAAAAGLPLVGDHKNPLITTTFGVGELILHAHKNGIKKILMGIGGSSTNDCGIGMASALGFSFLDKDGNTLEPLAKNLINIKTIVEPVNPIDIEITAACDVNNPLTGPDGATYTFGPQKGATKEMLKELEAGMINFEQVMTEHYGISCKNIAGTGAAGGLGAAILQMLKGKLQPGIDLLLDAVGFDDMLKDADIVLTGEGRIDWQSAHGKVPMGVGLRCKSNNVPCVALCGSIGERAEDVYNFGITAIFSAVKGVTTFAEIQQTCAEDIRFLTDSVAKIFAIKG